MILIVVCLTFITTLLLFINSKVIHSRNLAGLSLPTQFLTIIPIVSADYTKVVILATMSISAAYASICQDFENVPL